MKQVAANGSEEVEPVGVQSTVASKDRQAWKRPSDFLLLGTLFGLVTGIAEVTVRWFIFFVPPDLGFVWMLPLAYLLMFGAVGMLIGLASRRWHGDRLARVALAVFGAVSAYVILAHFGTIHDIASIILSIGVGVRIAGLLGRSMDRLGRFVRRVTWPAVCVVVLTAVAFRATAAVKEHRAVAGLVPPAARAPNVLLIVMDAVRAPNLSVYGYPRRTTPKLERFAERSVRFERAIVTAPWTLPSHASMFTGRFPHEMSADWDVPLDATDPTLAEVLRDRGYVTAGFVANHSYGHPEFGLSRGFLHYESRQFNFWALIATTKLGRGVIAEFNRLTRSYHRPARMSAPEINRRLLRWLPSTESRPFFVFVNYFDAHAPYVAPPPFNRLFSGIEPPTRRIREGHRKFTKAELRGLRDAYDQTISYLDSHLGVLLGELERRQLLSNTVVIVTSDHGEEFGEHGWATHGNGLYLPVLRVPLLMSFPGRVPAGRIIAEPVTLRDLPETVLDLLGLSGQVDFPGHSLSPRWEAATDSLRVTTSPVLSELSVPMNATPWYAVARGDMKSIIVGKHHYIRNGDGREELFDIIADPWEAIDLAGSQGGKAVLAVARTTLDSAMRVGRRAVAKDRIRRAR